LTATFRRFHPGENGSIEQHFNILLDWCDVTKISNLLVLESGFRKNPALSEESANGFLVSNLVRCGKKIFVIQLALRAFLAAELLAQLNGRIVCQFHQMFGACNLILSIL
jgi:hypothetical protein